MQDFPYSTHCRISLCKTKKWDLGSRPLLVLAVGSYRKISLILHKFPLFYTHFLYSTQLHRFPLFDAVGQISLIRRTARFPFVRFPLFDALRDFPLQDFPYSTHCGISLYKISLIRRTAEFPFARFPLFDALQDFPL